MWFLKKKRKVGKTLSQRARYRPNLGIPIRHHPLQKRSTVILAVSKKPSHTTKRIVAYLATLILIITTGLLTYFVSFSNYFLIKDISVKFKEENDMNDKIDINKYIAPYIQTNLLFFDEKSIKAQAMKAFPQISNIEVKKVLPNHVKLEITTYEIVANIINRLAGRERKFQILNSGYLIKEGNEDPSLPYIVISSETLLQPLSQIISPDNLSYILEASKGFNEKFNMRVLDSEYLPIGREVHLRTEKNFLVWLDMEQPWGKQLNKLKQALTKLDIYQIPLKYIDLRIGSSNGEKVYYR